jgi:hydroxymethylbilane synthase
MGRGPLSWAALPQGATLATSSLRRRAQVLYHRPDLRVTDIRGNVDTRLAKLEAHGEWTAILLAVAGLVRLGLGDRIGERLAPEVMLPAPGQGALAVAARSDDATAREAAKAALHHAPTALAVTAERAFLRRLEGGCQVPVGALGLVRDSGGTRRLRLHGRVVSLGGERAVEAVEDAAALGDEEADALGVSLAERLLADGAEEILSAARAAAAPAVPEP